jgi:hypothetical protein
LDNNFNVCSSHLKDGVDEWVNFKLSNLWHFLDFNNIFYVLNIFEWHLEVHNGFFRASRAKGRELVLSANNGLNWLTWELEFRIKVQDTKYFSNFSLNLK